MAGKQQKIRVKLTRLVIPIYLVSVYLIVESDKVAAYNALKKLTGQDQSIEDSNAATWFDGPNVYIWVPPDASPGLLSHEATHAALHIKRFIGE